MSRSSPNPSKEMKANAAKETKVNAAKFRKVLERIQTKLTLRLPLTAEETRVAMEVERLSKLNTRVKYSADGRNLVIRRTNDAQPVIDHVRFLSDLQAEKPKKKSDDKRYVGSLDPISASRLASESNTRIGTREFSEYAAKRIRTDMTKFKA